MNWSAKTVAMVFQRLRNGTIKMAVGTEDGGKVHIIPPHLITDEVEQVWTKMFPGADAAVLALLAREAEKRGDMALATAMLRPGSLLMMRREDILPLLLAQHERPGGTVH